MYSDKNNNLVIIYVLFFKWFRDLYMKHECRKVSRIFLNFENAYLENLIVYSTNLFKQIPDIIHSKKIIFKLLIQQQMNVDSFSENCHWFHLFPFAYLPFVCIEENIHKQFDNFFFLYWWHTLCHNSKIWLTKKCFIL